MECKTVDIHPAVSRRSLLKGAAGAVPLAGFAAWNMKIQPAAAADESLIICIGTDFTSLDPDRFSSWNDYWVYGNIFEGLFGPDQKGELVPALAEALEISPDGLHYRFTLRAGAKFHNGDPVTTDDVLFSFKRSLDPATNNARAGLIGGNIANIEAINEKQFVVHLKKVDAQTIQRLSLFWQVKPKKYLESVGSEGFVKKPIGTGPFEFMEYRPNQYLKMRAFAGHWSGAPKATEVTLKIVPEEQTRLAQVMAGEANVATPVSPVLAARLGTMPNVEVIRVPAFTNIVLKFNPGHPEMQKKLVRQAICTAIDRDALLKTVMLGFASPQELWCTSAQPGCTLDGVTPYKFDPRRARALLEEAKFDFAKPFKFVGQAPGRVAASKETCEAIANYLKNVGMNIDLQILEPGIVTSILNSKHPKDPTVPIIYGTPPDSSPDLAYKLQVNCQSTSIPSWVNDPAIDEMVGKMDTFVDRNERNAMMNRILRRIHDEALMMPLWANDTLYVTAKGVKFQIPPYFSFTMLRDVSKA